MTLLRLFSPRGEFGRQLSSAIKLFDSRARRIAEVLLYDFLLFPLVFFKLPMIRKSGNVEVTD